MIGRGAPIAILVAAIVFVAGTGGRSAPVDRSADIARGAALVSFGACNDCHTPGWRESDGTIPKKKWMTGSNIGFRGPWGTVYPANVRLEFHMIDEGQWLSMVRTRGGHPPMTWHDIRGLSVADQRAIYRFVRSLGATGRPSHRDVPPDLTPDTPYYDVAPVTPSPS